MISTNASGEIEMGIPGDFPKGAVRVAEVSGIPSPIGISCRFGDLCSRLCGLAQNGVDFGPGTDIVRKSDPAKSLPAGSDLRIQGKFFSREKGKPRSTELEKQFPESRHREASRVRLGKTPWLVPGRIRQG